jgi:hypothetical protein
MHRSRAAPSAQLGRAQQGAEQQLFRVDMGPSRQWASRLDNLDVDRHLNVIINSTFKKSTVSAVDSTACILTQPAACIGAICR